jgi:hypothetical protein
MTVVIVLERCLMMRADHLPPRGAQMRGYAMDIGGCLWELASRAI